MSEQLKERKEMDSAFMWDLSCLYTSDEAWEEDLKKVDKYVEEAAAFRGTLNTPESVLKFMNWQTEAERLLSNLFVYASQRHDEDTRDSKAQGMYARMYGKYVRFSEALSFAQPEFLSLDSEKLAAITADESLKDYRFLLENMMRQKPHVLSAKEEQVLAALGEALSAAGETAESLRDADLIFDEAIDKDGEKHQLSESSYIPLEMSQDRELRESAFRAYYKTYGQHIHTFASAYAGCVKGATAEARLRGYDSSRQMSMASDNIPETVYDNLISSVRNHMDLMYRYLRLRKEILGVEELHYYDVYAPLSQTDTRKFTYEEAKQMVLEAVAPLGKEYQDRVRAAYEENWIDVYPNKGKRGGAYSSGTYDSKPYILLNFNGSLDSVSTLAHEMGHSQHSWLTNHTQKPQYGDYSLFVAEVASTVNENLLIEQLLAKCEDPALRLALLNQYLEGFKGTVYRQTMFAEFERNAHAMQERGESLDSDALSNMYAGLIKDYFGEDLVLDDEVKYEWARIPHFYRPFYVYVYATGYSSAVALSEAILHEGEPAVKRYLDFLSMGSSAYPLDELKAGGVDLSTPAPVDMALEKFARVLDDAERTLAELRK